MSRTLMKTVYFFSSCLLLFFSAGIFSCNKDPEVKISEVLLGTWNVESLFINGVNANTDTANYRIQFDVDSNTDPSTYTITSNPGVIRPNYESQASNGQWRLNTDETVVIFDPNSSTPSSVNLGEFDIAVRRIAVPLSWTSSNSESYVLTLARYEEE